MIDSQKRIILSDGTHFLQNINTRAISSMIEKNELFWSRFDFLASFSHDKNVDSATKYQINQRSF